MRVNWSVLKFMALIVVLIFVYGFTNHRSSTKEIKGFKIKFLDNNDLYLTEEAVNKLLIQNYGSVRNGTKDAIVLNTIEEVIQSNPMVKDAQVFLSLEGELISQIRLRKPIGRVEGASKFYLDDSGERMPLSKHHSARVPIITGKVTGETLQDAYKILTYISQDEFLRKNVIGIHIVDVDDYVLKLRIQDFEVRLGDADNLNEKFKNFMAFYAKASKDKTLNAYAAVSLEFDNQVVCTKI